MDGRVKALLTTAVVIAFSVCALSKTQLHDSSEKTSDFKVTIISDKKIFVLHERVYTRVEFRNLGHKTYCFPKPSRDCTNDFPGSAVTTGQPLANNGDFEQFICHYDTGGPPSSSNLESEIKHHWVILAPNDVYLSDRAEAKVDLSLLGEWRLETTYSQPQGAFSPAWLKKYLTSKAKSVGCIFPPAPIESEPVTIQVVNVANKDQEKMY
jgi:hypothetical protein